MVFLRRWRRARARRRPFPEAWRAALRKNVPRYRSMEAEERVRLEDRIKVFLADKWFEGCAGLEMTDEIRVTIGAQACMLLLGRDEDDVYPSLRTILVYPASYVAEFRQQGPAGVVTEGEHSRLGESWHRGAVVLSWSDVLAGAADMHDGRNVVYHEFAHQLDSEFGGADGAPLLPERSMYTAWARVLGREYEALARDLEQGRPPAIDPYGATNPAEFFAVATEYFFERPRLLRERSPELYEQLALFYGQDPGGAEER